MKQIYISHIPDDRNYALRLESHLTQVGFTAFVNRRTRTGYQWGLEVFDAIRQSEAVVVIVSAQAAKSPDVTYEWSVALGAGIPIIPIIFRGVNAHPHLMILDTFDFIVQADERQVWQQFMREFSRIIKQPLDNSDEAILNKISQRSTDTIPVRMQFVSRDGYYLVIKEGNKPERTFQLTAASVSLGRDNHNDIQIPNTGISRSHLRFVRTNAGYQAIDMGSTNGTLLNNDFITAVELKPGDTLRVGEDVYITYKFEE
jgi:hypothetical protein